MKNIKEKSRCPNCKGEFIPSRDNMRYCHKGCRIEFNNTKNNNKRKFLSKMEKPIAKNYEILETILNGENEKLVHEEFLKGKGFDFRVMTHVYDMDKDKNIVAGCHDIHYYKTDDQHFKIRKNDKRISTRFQNCTQ